MNLKVLFKKTKEKNKKCRKFIFNATIFANALFSFIKNICELVKFGHK